MIQIKVIRPQPGDTINDNAGLPDIIPAGGNIIMLRDIVIIDEDKCDGCGLCMKACAEGAIRLIKGKARLVADLLCDGMGTCLGHCPRDAIRIEKREAAAFDENAVEAHLQATAAASGADIHAYATQPAAPQPKPAACPSSRTDSPSSHSHAGGGCPGTRFAQFEQPATTSAPAGDGPALASELTHWPVQLRLLNPMAPVLKGAHVLVAADCVPVAFPDFQRKLLRGRAVVIACPKLDDTSTYTDKLADIIRHNRPADITVAHMEVPCCTGILMMVLEARKRSGIDIPVIDVVVSIRGDILREKEMPLDAAA